ncbi:hypothetical protein IKA15_01355 [bacterium]|nr:hypothetical protein [bacterium]
MIFKNNSKPKFAVPKFAKILLGTFAGILGFIYLSFLFILPNVIKFENYLPLINTELAKITPVTLDTKGLKLKTTPKLDIGATAENIALIAPDKSTIISISHPSIEINIPSIIFGKINLEKIYAKDITLNLVYKNKKYTILDYFAQSAPQTQTQNENKEEANADFPLELGKIKVIVDNLALNLKDEDINKSFNLSAKNSTFKLNSLEGPLQITTKGNIARVDVPKKYLDFDVNLSTKLPEFEESKSTAQTAEMELFNPFAMIDTLGAHANILADLKINDLENFNAKGYLKVDEATIMLDGKKLPNSNLDLNFDKNKIKIDTKLYIAQNEFLTSNGFLELGKKAKINLQTKCDKASLSQIKNHIGAVLTLFNIKNDFKSIIAKGYINCDFNIDSDFKKIKSDGFIKLAEGGIAYPKANVNLTNIASTIDFTGNKMTIKDTHASLNNAKFQANGVIDTNSKMDLKISSDPLKISEIVKLLSSLKLVNEKDLKDLAFNGGTIKAKADIKGSFEKPEFVGNASADSINILIKSLNAPLTISKASATITPVGNDFNLAADVTSLNFKVQNAPQGLSLPSAKITGNSEKITIEPFKILMGTNFVTTSGYIEDYMKKPEIELSAQGNISPEFILSFIPQDLRKNIAYKGAIPLSASIEGDIDDINIKGNITTSPNNYINIIGIENIKGQTVKTACNINLKGNDLIINDISAQNVFNAKGKIANIYAKNPTISNIAVNIPQKLNIILEILDNTKLSAKGNLNITGSVAKPEITGQFAISNLNYPTFKLTVENALINFKKSMIAATATGIKVGKSDFRGELNLNSDISKYITINNLNFSSGTLDADEIMQIVASAPNTQTTAGPTSNIIVKTGKGIIGNLKSGTILLQNISFNLKMANDLVTLSDLKASAYDGVATGSASYHLSQLKTGFNIAGKNINVAKASKAFVGVTLPTSGTLEGIVKGEFRGATFTQQMKTLTGNAKFTVKNGVMKDFIKFENFLYAGNLLSENILGFNLNNAISSVSKVNTGEFSSLEGTLTFGNGWATINKFTSRGANMSLYATGKYNLLTNYADMKILGRISPHVANKLGPVGDFTLNKVLEKMPSKALAVLEAVKTVAPKNPLLATISKDDIAKIPELTAGSAEGEKEFQVLIQGLVSSVKSVKSFKWAQ